MIGETKQDALTYEAKQDVLGYESLKKLDRKDFKYEIRTKYISYSEIKNIWLYSLNQGNLKHYINEYNEKIGSIYDDSLYFLYDTIFQNYYSSFIDYKMKKN